LFVYNKRSGSAGLRHSIFYALNVQRRAARFVINDYTSKTQGCVTSMLTSLEWQTLEQQRRINRLVMMYKIQHQLVDINRDLYLRPGDSRTRKDLKSYGSAATLIMLLNISRMDRLRFGHERPTDSDSARFNVRFGNPHSKFY
jgi:hypothetical protein